jgi:hypothetical protein
LCGENKEAVGADMHRRKRTISGGGSRSMLDMLDYHLFRWRMPACSGDQATQRKMPPQRTASPISGRSCNVLELDKEHGQDHRYRADLVAAEVAALAFLHEHLDALVLLIDELLLLIDELQMLRNK